MVQQQQHWNSRVSDDAEANCNPPVRLLPLVFFESSMLPTLTTYYNYHVIQQPYRSSVGTNCVVNLLLRFLQRPLLVVSPQESQRWTEVHTCTATTTTGTITPNNDQSFIYFVGIPTEVDRVRYIYRPGT